jgi:hypothetical protein
MQTTRHTSWRRYRRICLASTITTIAAVTAGSVLIAALPDLWMPTVEGRNMSVVVIAQGLREAAAGILMLTVFVVLPWLLPAPAARQTP